MLITSMPSFYVLTSVLIFPVIVFYCYGAHRDLHVLTHSFPTRRSSDLQEDALRSARTHFEQQFNAPGALWGDRRSGDDAGLSLHSVLRNTTLAATRSVDVRCPTCPGLSPDEARLLDAVAWLQRDIAEIGRASCRERVGQYG